MNWKEKPVTDPTMGALMIGGRSTRMGADKALIAKGATTLASHLARLLEKVIGTAPVLVGEGEIGDDCAGLDRVKDREPGAGPLSGLLGLFRRYPNHHFLVLATDLYAMDESALDWLLDQARLQDRSAIWPRFPDRPFGEPLASFYRASAGPLLDRRWRLGVRALRKGLTPLERAEPLIPDAHRLAFINVNTPEALARLRARLADENNELA